MVTLTKDDVCELALAGKVPNWWTGGLCRHVPLGTVFLPAQSPGDVTPYAVVVEEYSAHSYRDSDGAYYQPSVVAYIPVDISEAWDPRHAQCHRSREMEIDIQLQLDGMVADTARKLLSRVRSTRQAWEWGCVDYPRRVTRQECERRAKRAHRALRALADYARFLGRAGDDGAPAVAAAALECEAARRWTAEHWAERCRAEDRVRSARRALGDAHRRLGVVARRATRTAKTEQREWSDEEWAHIQARHGEVDRALGVLEAAEIELRGMA